jgi:hypothetical protein
MEDTCKGIKFISGFSESLFRKLGLFLEAKYIIANSQMALSTMNYLLNIGTELECVKFFYQSQELRWFSL